MGVTPEELADAYPLLYHMADANSWPNIRKHGLLSTSALLDLFEVERAERRRIEGERRPESVEIINRQYGRAVVRDQKPLIESKLAKTLTGCTVSEFHRLLNKHVFFWLTKERLRTLLCARAYRDKPHVVLTVKTLPFAKHYQKQIALSPMNSGNTQPFAHPRSPDIFMKMGDYPFEERAKYGRQFQVVELAVEGGVQVNEMVESVDLMRCHGKGMRTLNNFYCRK